MRNLAVIVLLGAIGYYGWQAYKKDPEAFAKFLPKQQTEEVASGEGSDSGAATPSTENASTPVATPPPAPVFASRIKVDGTPAEGEKKTLPPGQFLVIERASIETKDGVFAIVPGDTVKLIERKGNGTLIVTNGKNDFTIKESQVTQDVGIAQEAERREFQKRYGGLR